MVISKTGAARVCDYGLFSAIPDPHFTDTPETVGASRWLAPELIDPLKIPVSVSKSTDVFAFAMLAVEVFSGDIPFGNMRNEMATLHIVQGEGLPNRRLPNSLPLLPRCCKMLVRKPC